MRSAALAALLLCLLPATAAADWAPLDLPGPKLGVATADVRKALTCSDGIDGAKRAPVLLIHGTGATVEENWEWTYQPAFNRLGIPWCAVQLPQRGGGDIQVNGEYVVFAIRDMYRRAGRKISTVGHSQGGMLPRWALRFWPDTRPMVDDVISFAASNHGTTQARLTCRPTCSPASWQQMDGSAFINALNSRTETFAGISYTNAYTRFDEVVQPNADDSGSSSLRPGPGQITNVAIQDICPLAVSEHLVIGLTDPVAYALALDALHNGGPASEARVARNGCAQSGIPGLKPEGGLRAVFTYSRNEGGAAEVPIEPPLRCFTTASCPVSQRPKLVLTVAPKRAIRGKVRRLRFRVRTRVNGRLVPVRRALIRAGGRKVRSARNGRAALRVRFRKAGRRRITVTSPGYARGVARVRVIRR